MFYLDGAHSPESMEICARWFSLATKEKNHLGPLHDQGKDDSGLLNEDEKLQKDGRFKKNTTKVRQ